MLEKLLKAPLIQRVWSALDHFTFEEDTQELIFLKKVGVIAFFLAIFNALGLGWFVASFQRPLVGWLTSLVVLLMVILLIHFYVYKNWKLFLWGSIIFTIGLPTANQFIMGGFITSAGTVFWILPAVIYAVVGLEGRSKFFVVESVIVISIILGFIEPWYGESSSRFPPWVEGYLFANLLVSLALFAAIPLNFYMQKLLEEKQTSESLLLNILPKTIADELKIHGKSVPQLYTGVTVIFADIKGFTRYAHQLPPNLIVAALNECFLAFDRIVDQHGFEKIKTIGDAYMCAGGVPTPLADHALKGVKIGQAMLAFMDQWKTEQRSQGQLEWDLRIGIHTGEVIAGVIGQKKFAYDIWGDTVNIASRMESAGESGKSIFHRKSTTSSQTMFPALTEGK